MTKPLRTMLAAASATVLMAAAVPSAQAQNTDNTASESSETSSASSQSSSTADSEQLGDASSRGSSLDEVDSVEDYAEWTSSGAEMASSGDPALSAEGSSRLAIDWVIGAVVVSVIGAIIYTATTFL